MGVEVLWMMPIYPIGVLNRKGTMGSYYSIKDFCDVNAEFGTREDFKVLVEKVHDYGMKLIIDWVANHASWDNVWTKTNPDFFVKDGAGNFKSPYDWSDVIQIDHSSVSEQAAMLDAMKFWITEFNVDGFRADLAHLTPLSFWVNARKFLSTIKNDLIWLAETDEINYYDAFDIVYAWKWMHVTEAFFKEGKDINSLNSLLEKQNHDLTKDAVQLYFTSNHDENSWNGTEYEKYGIYAKALAVFNYTYPNSIPLIYSGQELPNCQRLAFFEKDAIEWAGTIELHSFYKTLIAFHKNNFSAGELRFLPAQKNMFAFIRQHEDRSVLVFLNFSREKLKVNYTVTGVSGNYQNIFTGETVSLSEIITIELDPGSYLVLNKKN